jgi:hypothetical protein
LHARSLPRSFGAPTSTVLPDLLKLWNFWTLPQSDRCLAKIECTPMLSPSMRRIFLQCTTQTIETGMVRRIEACYAGVVFLQILTECFKATLGSRSHGNGHQRDLGICDLMDFQLNDVTKGGVFGVHDEAGSELRQSTCTVSDAKVQPS